jgi:TorA maturation chaperone TorD
MPLAPPEATLHAARANTYRLLADGFRSPLELNPAALRELPRQLGACWSEGVASAEALLTAVPEGDAAWEPLRVAHAALFVGPFHLLAPPYGSVYLDVAGEVMGDSTLAALEHYVAAGLDVDSAQHEPPDHIATELEFMYYLAFQHVTTGEAAYLERQRAFLSQHLARWLPLLAERIQAAAQHPFYTALGELTHAFVREDRARVT